MRSIDDIAKALAQLLKQKKTQGYDTEATVTKVEDGVTWAHIPGGVEETPIRQTIAAEPGDVIQLRVAGGRAWITGNATSPPTDDKAAHKASAAANKAQKTADEALKVKQYFWHDNAGAHVTEMEQGSFIRNPAGGNVLLESRGLHVRDGLDDIANFLSDEISMKNSDGVTIFELTSESSQAGLEVTQADPGTLRFPPEMPFTVNGYWTDSSDHEFWNVTVTAPGTYTINHGGVVVYTVTNGIHSVEVEGTGHSLRSIVYTTHTPLPYLTFGTRDGDPGAFSGTVGDGLIAKDPGLVCGRYNSERYYPVAFAVGVGTGSRNRKNALEVKSDGEVKANLITAGEIDAQRGEFTELEIDGDELKTHWGSANISVTSGTLVDAQLYVSGKLRMLKITAKNSGTTAAGGNIFEATLNKSRPPVYITSGSYYGQYAIGGSLGTNGQIIIRNATGQSLGSMGSNSVTVTFTYIVP